VAVLRSIAPASVVIQVSGANYARGNIARGDGVILPLIATLAPFIEAVGTRRIDNLMGE
jgi:hypothetical protein